MKSEVIRQFPFIGLTITTMMFFLFFFLAVVCWVYWPRSDRVFDRFSRLPLENEEVEK